MQQNNFSTGTDICHRIMCSSQNTSPWKYTPDGTPTLKLCVPVRIHVHSCIFLLEHQPNSHVHLSEHLSEHLPMSHVFLLEHPPFRCVYLSKHLPVSRVFLSTHSPIRPPNRSTQPPPAKPNMAASRSNLSSRWTKYRPEANSHILSP